MYVFGQYQSVLSWHEKAAIQRLKEITGNQTQTGRIPVCPHLFFFIVAPFILSYHRDNWIFKPVTAASRCVLRLVFTASCMEVSHIKILDDVQKFFIFISCIQYLPVSVCCTLSSAPGNQSPLSQATPCWVLQRNNECTVAEYFIFQPAPSIPTLFASWDRGPVLVKSSFMRRRSNWAHWSSRVDFFLPCFYV